MPLARVPIARRLPQHLSRLRPDLVLFDSWHGRYSDNPRAISEQLNDSHPHYEQVWALNDPSDAPDWAEVVQPDTRRYLQCLGAAGYIVANNSMPRYFRKKRGTTYVQTWHGTPLKRIAFDVPQPSAGVTARYLRGLAVDVSMWDFLVAQNRFSAEMLPKAFDYRGPVIESGYPRNDLLLSDRRDSVRASVRAELGIEPATRAVLYAPTWRDDRVFELELDLDAAIDSLGSDHVVLVRAHHLVAQRQSLGRRTGVRDVSRRPDIRELYLAADVLVTDYSSVMFDFAVTGKPMLFFTYDLATYRSDLRGFYFDFEKEAPGPMLSTTAEVIAALRGLDGIVDEFAARYRRFQQRFCPLDDGRAARRVIDAVFNP